MNTRTFSAAALLGITMAVATPGAAQKPGGAQQPGDESTVGTTINLEFHSNFWLNLHHLLYEAASDGRSEADAARVAEFRTSLPPEEQRIWDGAVDLYKRNVASKDLLFDFQMTAIKVALGEAGQDLADAGRALPAPIKNALETAAPIYRAHAWAADDRENRAWIAEARRHLEELAPEVTPRLASLYGTVWPTTPVRVDAVRVVIPKGAYTSDGPPDWIVASSSDPDMQGWAQAETLFHETSHLMIHPVEQALYVAARDLHVPPPRALWHVVLFYTAGELTKQALARRKVAYEPYLYKTGLFDRAWPMYRAAIEAVLPKFVSGKDTREEMAHALLRKIGGAETQGPPPRRD